MNYKLSSIFFKELNHVEKSIYSNVLIQSSILFFMLLAGGFLLLSNIKIFEISQIGIVIMSCLYWRVEVFLYDPQRVQFGIFIISGTLIGIFYTVSVWIDLYKSKS